MMKVVIVLEEQASGDVKIGILSEGTPTASPREVQYARTFQDMILHMVPKVAQVLGGKSVELLPGRHSGN